MAHIPFFVVFALALAWRLWITVAGPNPGPGWNWGDAILWCSAAATCVAGLARWMPAQNAIGAGLILAALAALVELVGQETGFPFGAYNYLGAMGEKAELGKLGLLRNLPWPILLYWVAILLSSRGVARVLLRPWRRYGQYGLWVIVVAGLLSLWLVWGTETFLVKVAASKEWIRSNNMARDVTPWTFYVAWPVASLLALVFVAPWLILKPPVKAPTDLHPVLVWVLLAALVMVGCVKKACWPAAVGMGVAIPVVGLLALRCKNAPVLPPLNER